MSVDSIAWEHMLSHLLLAAGIGHFVLCGASLAIPAALGWGELVRGLPRLLRQVFWTYAFYILGAHFAFGLVSVAARGELLCGSRLAAGVTGFIALWWGVRLVIHWAGFDMSELPDAWWARWGKRGLGLLFFGFSEPRGVGMIGGILGCAAIAAAAALAGRVWVRLPVRVGRLGGWLALMAAVFAVFVLSGVFHEVAITVPVRAGFGLPTAYFIIQGLAVDAERWIPSGWPRRAWAALCVLAPVGILFPEPFRKEILLPFFWLVTG